MVHSTVVKNEAPLLVRPQTPRFPWFSVGVLSTPYCIVGSGAHVPPNALHEAEKVGGMDPESAPWRGGNWWTRIQIAHFHILPC